MFWTYLKLTASSLKLSSMKLEKAISSLSHGIDSFSVGINASYSNWNYYNYISDSSKIWNIKTSLNLKKLKFSKIMNSISL